MRNPTKELGPLGGCLLGSFIKNSMSLTSHITGAGQDTSCEGKGCPFLPKPYLLREREEALYDLCCTGEGETGWWDFNYCIVGQ